MTKTKALISKASWDLIVVFIIIIALGGSAAVSFLINLFWLFVALILIGLVVLIIFLYFKFKDNGDWV